jgi:hypothetical protein
VHLYQIVGDDDVKGKILDLEGSEIQELLVEWNGLEEKLCPDPDTGFKCIDEEGVRTVIADRARKLEHHRSNT